MGNVSLAAQSVANGPMTAAQPSFNGHGWLVVINLALMTAAALICAMAAGRALADLWRDRKTLGPLVAAFRATMAMAFGGMTIRTGVEALSLWGWDPHRPVQTGMYLFVKRLLDPFGAAAYLVAACAFILIADAMVAALERRPWPDRIVASLPKLRNPAILAGLSVVAAIGVVSLR